MGLLLLYWWSGELASRRRSGRLLLGMARGGLVACALPTASDSDGISTIRRAAAAAAEAAVGEGESCCLAAGPRGGERRPLLLPLLPLLVPESLLSALLLEVVRRSVLVMPLELLLLWLLLWPGGSSKEMGEVRARWRMGLSMRYTHRVR